MSHSVSVARITHSLWAAIDSHVLEFHWEVFSEKCNEVKPVPGRRSDVSVSQSPSVCWRKGEIRCLLNNSEWWPFALNRIGFVIDQLPTDKDSRRCALSPPFPILQNQLESWEFLIGQLEQHVTAVKVGDLSYSLQWCTSEYLKGEIQFESELYCLRSPSPVGQEKSEINVYDIDRIASKH